MDASSVVNPQMLSKASGMHEFEDVFKELIMTHEQEKIFDRLMAPPPPKKSETAMSLGPPASSRRGASTGS